MSSLTLPIQTASIAISLMSCGGVAALSLFNIPLLQAQPASRSLPAIRWVFSRGSHTFPTSFFTSAAGFIYLAINALPNGRAASSIYRLSSNPVKTNAYLAAVALILGVGPFSSLTMIPMNFRLIELNEKNGGARSQRSADEGSFKPGERSADESVALWGNKDISQVTDLSGPQTQTKLEVSEADEKEVHELLGKFGRLNLVRALMVGTSGVIALVATLT